MTLHTFGLIGLPFCLAWSGWALYKTYQGMATSRWSKVPCTITRLDVLAQPSSISDQEAFEIQSEYSYQVAGHAYTGVKVTNSHSQFLSRSEVESLTSRLPKNGPAFAYYNPRNPLQAVLVQGSDMAAAKELLGALVCAGLAAFLLTR
jgi:hypothetical protein